MDTTKYSLSQVLTSSNLATVHQTKAGPYVLTPTPFFHYNVPVVFDANPPFHPACTPQALSRLRLFQHADRIAAVAIRVDAWNILDAMNTAAAWEDLHANDMLANVPVIVHLGNYVTGNFPKEDPSPLLLLTAKQCYAYKRKGNPDLWLPTRLFLRRVRSIFRADTKAIVHSDNALAIKAVDAAVVAFYKKYSYPFAA